MRALLCLIVSLAAMGSTHAQQMKTPDKQPKGVIGKTYKDGLPVIWRFVNQTPTRQKREALPWLTVISWRYDGSTNNGMPPKAVNDRMIALEDAIEKEVEKRDFCEHAITRTGSNLKELIYYVHDRAVFTERFNAALQSHEAYPIEITFYEDRQWKEHEEARSIFSKGEQGGPANGSQPIRGNTNTTSSAAGSRR